MACYQARRKYEHVIKHLRSVFKQCMDTIYEAVSYCPLTSEFHSIHNVYLLTAFLGYIFIIFSKHGNLSL